MNTTVALHFSKARKLRKRLHEIGGAKAAGDEATVLQRRIGLV
jgi:hypothetical protein